MAGAAGRVEVEVEVAAPPEAVWRAIAEPEELRAWWAHLELEARPGGRLVERWRDAGGRDVTTRGEVVAADAPALLRATWRDDGWPAATLVELALVPRGAGTRVRLRHGGWDGLGESGRGLAGAHRQGWEAHLAALKRHVETGAG